VSESRILIVGGGPAGLEAARDIADLGGRVLLVEKEQTLGGTPIHSHYAALTPDLEDAETAMQRKIDAIANDPLIDVRTGTTVIAASGDAPAVTVTLSGPAGEQSEEVAAVVVCTGFQHFDPGREQLMAAVLASLPPDQREVIALRFFGGHSYAEMAGILGVPEGTVKSRIFYAIKHCREEFRLRLPGEFQGGERNDR